MAKSRAFARDTKRKTKEAPKKQSEVGERAGSRSSSRANSRSGSVSSSRSRSTTPTKRRSSSSRGSTLESPRKSTKRSDSRGSSPRGSTPRDSGSKGSGSKGSGNTFTKIMVVLQIGVVLLAIFAIFFAIYYFSPRYHLGLDIVPAMGGDRLYFARDLSCFTFFGYKPQCSKFTTRWAEYGCDERKNVIIVGAVFACVGAALAIAVLVLILLVLLGCCPLIFIAFILAIVAAVALTVAWVIVLAVYLASMCEGETEEEPGYSMKKYTTLGPGMFFLLIGSLLEITVAFAMFFLVGVC